ncbi:MAG TPA: proline dehydrogenase family protein, partial [Xanthobacteraceae bacterium]
MHDNDPQTFTAIAAFRAAYAPADEDVAAVFLKAAPGLPEAELRIDARARRLVEAIRAKHGVGGVGGIEDFLHEYSLSTREGLALMVLAEALLRVPDAATADRLIEDKLTGADFAAHTHSGALLVSASAWALGISARVVATHETPESILHELVSRLGRPAVRTATRQAMRLLGSHFVLGQTIEEALSRGAARPEFRYSFDMLGEGARTAADAARYFEAYKRAIAAIGRSAGASGLPQRPGISVKLSALHPRYEAISRTRVLNELAPRVLALARAAREHDLNLTIDAEEADRLELSLDIVARTFASPDLIGWSGFGLAVQTYQKRAPAVIDWVVAAARSLGRPIMVRLVKGAYWDTEVKRAQERGLDDYPVFSRKAMTDLCYMTCARKLLAARPHVYP